MRARRKMSMSNVDRLVRKDPAKKRSPIYGAVYKLADGRQVYLAWRWNSEIFRSGEKTISDAVSKGVACWAIDNDTLIRLRIEGVYLIGVAVADTGDIYISTLNEFNTAPVLNFNNRGGSLQRYLNLKKFRVLNGVTRIK